MAAPCGLLARASVLVADWSGFGLGWLGLTWTWLDLGCWLRIRFMRYERFEGYLWVFLVGLVLRGAGLIGGIRGSHS